MRNIIFLTIASIAVFVAIIAIKPLLGVYPYGPQRNITATVERLYVDYSGSGDSRKSHYMVGTSVGVFEVDNSLWLWIWNADEIYSQMEQGKTYALTIKGKRRVGWLFQSYPGVIRVSQQQDSQP